MKRFLLIVFVASLLGCQEQSSTNPSELPQPSAGLAPKVRMNNVPFFSFQRAVFSPGDSNRRVLTSFRVTPPGYPNSNIWQGRVALWDIASGKLLWVHDTNDSTYPWCFLDRGTKVLISSGIHNGSGLELLDAATGKPVPNWEGYLGGVVPSKDGRHTLACRAISTPEGTRYVFEIWDVLTAKRVRVVLVGSEPLSPLIWSADDKTALCGIFSPEATLTAIALWDVTTGKEIRRIERPAEGWDTTHDAWAIPSPDGKRAITGKRHREVDERGTHWNEQLVVWDIGTGKEAARLRFDRDVWAVNMAFAPDNDHLLFGTNKNTIEVWDINRHDSTRIITTRGESPDHMQRHSMFFFSDDGELAFEGCQESQPYLCIWNINSGKLVREFDSGLPHKQQP